MVLSTVRPSERYGNANSNPRARRLKHRNAGNPDSALLFMVDPLKGSLTFSRSGAVQAASVSDPRGRAHLLRVQSVPQLQPSCFLAFARRFAAASSFFLAGAFLLRGLRTALFVEPASAIAALTIRTSETNPSIILASVSSVIASCCWANAVNVTLASRAFSTVVLPALGTGDMGFGTGWLLSDSS